MWTRFFVKNWNFTPSFFFRFKLWGTIQKYGRIYFCCVFKYLQFWIYFVFCYFSSVCRFILYGFFSTFYFFVQELSVNLNVWGTNVSLQKICQIVCFGTVRLKSQVHFAETWMAVFVYLVTAWMAIAIPEPKRSAKSFTLDQWSYFLRCPLQQLEW